MKQSWKVVTMFYSQRRSGGRFILGELGSFDAFLSLEQEALLKMILIFCRYNHEKFVIYTYNNNNCFHSHWEKYRCNLWRWNNCDECLNSIIYKSSSIVKMKCNVWKNMLHILKIKYLKFFSDYFLLYSLFLPSQPFDNVVCSHIGRSDVNLNLISYFFLILYIKFFLGLFPIS